MEVPLVWSGMYEVCNAKNKLSQNVDGSVKSDYILSIAVNALKTQGVESPVKHFFKDELSVTVNIRRTGSIGRPCQSSTTSLWLNYEDCRQPGGGA